MLKYVSERDFGNFSLRGDGNGDNDEKTKATKIDIKHIKRIVNRMLKLCNLDLLSPLKICEDRRKQLHL